MKPIKEVIKNPSFQLLCFAMVVGIIGGILDDSNTVTTATVLIGVSIWLELFVKEYRND